MRCPYVTYKAPPPFLPANPHLAPLDMCVTFTKCRSAAALNPQVTFGKPASSGETSSGQAAASPAHRGAAGSGLHSAASSGLKTSSGELHTATSADSSERRRTSWSGAHADKMPKHGGRRRHIASLVTLPLPHPASSADAGHDQ